MHAFKRFKFTMSYEIKFNQNFRLVIYVTVKFHHTVTVLAMQ